MTKLHHAVQAGDSGLVESLIQSGASVNCRDEYGQTPLHYAAERGFIECMEVLVMHGADLRIVDKSGFSPFLWAVVAGQEGAITGLLFMDADANSFSADGKSALAWAASLGWYSTAKMVVEYRASISDIRDTQQTLPLEEAAASGNLPTVRLLLECGEDPNHRDRDGWSAIHWAAEEGHLEIVRLLLEAGANPNAVSSYAIHSRDLATVRILLDKSVIAEPQALLDESGLTAEEWLDRGPASHSQKATGNLAFSKSRCCRAVTSLRRAVTSGNVPMIKLLFKLGHDINGMNSGRRTALYYAAKKRMLSIMDLLLELGADPNVLPAGRKNWEEIIWPGDVLLRLNRAGYWKRDTDHEVERQIRQAPRVQSQPPVLDQPAWFVSDESTSSMPDQSVSHGSDRPPSPVPASSTPPSPDHAASSRPTHSPAPKHQTNDKKRKAKSGRTDWWKRLVGGS
ncbi:hypothetical protein LTR61_011680 [Exophiala xenobiotica]|nr:hypothetical protein LTR61_011680 [Exophiala xenobiotica]